MGTLPLSQDISFTLIGISHSSVVIRSVDTDELFRDLMSLRAACLSESLLSACSGASLLTHRRGVFSGSSLSA